jgi:hypothetical protein
MKWVTRERSKVDRIACPWLIRHFVDQRDLTPESRGRLAIAQGFSEAYANDHEQLAVELPVYDALYAWSRLQARPA